MDLHTWIFVFILMAYLYYMTRVFDQVKILLIKKIKIHNPPNNAIEEQEKWRNQMNAIQSEIKKFKINSFLIFLIIPLVEVGAHFIVGDYFINSILLSLSFFILFLFCLLFLLFTYKGRKSDKLEKKYTWKSGIY